MERFCRLLLRVDMIYLGLNSDYDSKFWKLLCRKAFDDAQEMPRPFEHLGYYRLVVGGRRPSAF